MSDSIDLTFNCRGNDKQLECIKAWNNPEITDITYGGAKGGAKSFTGCSLISASALMYANTSYFIARKELGDLRKHTTQSLQEVWGKWNLTEKYWRFDGRDNFFEFYNKSRIYYLSAEYMPSDPHYYRFGSHQYTCGWGEEVGDWDEGAASNLFATLGRWNNDKYKIPCVKCKTTGYFNSLPCPICTEKEFTGISDFVFKSNKGKGYHGIIKKFLKTCNPSKNFLYKDYQDHKSGKLEPNKVFIQALPQDNKANPVGYVEGLYNRLKGAERERLLFGNWEYDDDPTTLIQYDRILDLFTNAHVRDANAEHFITADIARKGNDPASIWVWKGWEVIEIVDFKTSTTVELEGCIKNLQNKYSVPNSNVVIDEDGIGGGVCDHLPNTKGFLNGSSALNGENYFNLKTQCYYKWADKVNKAGAFFSMELSSKQREEIIQEHEYIRSWTIDSDGKIRLIPKMEVRKLIGRSPNYTDNCAMRMYFDLKYEGTPTVFEE